MGRGDNRRTKLKKRRLSQRKKKARVAKKKSGTKA